MPTKGTVPPAAGADWPQSAATSNALCTRSGRILVVEDQDDLRQMLVTALEIDGYEVEEAASAAEGLIRLNGAGFDLVLTDYAMPGGTGAWMLEEAGRLGLMSGTAALVVTAHPDVQQLIDVEVVAKPLDLDVFLQQVRGILAPPQGGADDGRRDDIRTLGPVTGRRHRVELVLYTSSASPASMQARRNLERLLEGFDRSQVKFTVCDLVREPLAGSEDRIAFTPTLVKKYPEPKMWVLGNLKEPEILSDLLRVCGVDAKK